MDVKSVLFLLLVAVALSQAQKKCCFPDQYESMDGLITATVQSGQGMAQTLGVQFAFDYTNRRVGEFFQLSGSMYQYVLDYNKGIMYVINLTMKSCQKSPLPIKQMQHCVPSNATYGGSFYAGDHKLTADTFSYPVNEGQVAGNVTLSVTKDNCIPFSLSFIGSMGGNSMLSVSGYVNYSPGIQDPSKYFTIPNYCPTFFTPEPKEGHAFIMPFLL
ncbi:development-specific protein LVN1.2-like isoform X2 [Patiria miniata]|uniref:Ependymin n=1 Tax=Patiria miniata TaxID=46514 RepID=A0A914A6L4_PATMI|nr:development-specific protein LVN1.2-like isoform X2 [Patiria miniata]XP_038059387.1 development-specific protein LVN1.2-like isoform X2 [Patiria miniata]